MNLWRAELREWLKTAKDYDDYLLEPVTARAILTDIGVLESHLNRILTLAIDSVPVTKQTSEFSAIIAETHNLLKERNAR